MQTALFDIKVFHQSHPTPKPLTGFTALKGLRNASKQFEDAVLAFQQITRADQTDERLLLELEFQRRTMFDKELGQLLMQIADAFGLNDNPRVLQARQSTFNIKERNRLIPGLKRFDEQGPRRFQALT